MEQIFISARDFALRLGFPRKSGNGIKTNHSAFLDRKAALHPNFPKARWLGGRKVYRLADVERFEALLPSEDPTKKRTAA